MWKTKDGRSLGIRVTPSFAFVLLVALAVVPAPAQGVSAVPGSSKADGQATASKADGVFAKERRQLLGSKSIAASETAIVVAKLVRSDDVRAHELLRETLAAVPERVSVATGIELVRALVRELGVDVDDGMREEARARVERRLEFYRDYVRPIAELCVRNADLLDKDLGAFGRDVRAYLTRLPHELRRRALAAMWKRPDDPAAKMAIRFAGASQEPDLAPELASLLSEPTLRDAARVALGELTWRVRPFADLADFEKWWQEHKGLTFRELTQRAAASARELGRLHRAELDAERTRLREKLLGRSRELLRALVAKALPDWKAIGALLADEDLREIRAPLLDELAASLVDRGAPTDEIRPTLGELSVLRDRLATEFRTSVDAERASLLAAWTLCAKWSGASAAKESVDRLLGFLVAGGGPVPLDRLFSLLQQFPEDRVREQVIAALEKPENVAALQAGLSCLRRLGSPGLAPLVERSLALLERVVRDGKLATKTREDALEVLGEIASTELAALQRLESLVVGGSESGLADGLRVTALRWAVLQGRSTMQRLGNGQLTQRATDELAFLYSCIRDASPRVRQESAKALAAFPGDVSNFTKEQIEDFARNIVGRVGLSLASETNSTCARHKLEVLVRQAERANVASVSLRHLVAAVATWTRDEKMRRDVLLPLQKLYREALAKLSLSEDLAPAVLIEHADALGAARLWFEQARILGAPALVATDAKLATKPDGLDVQTPVHCKKRAESILELCELRRSGAASEELLGGDLDTLVTSAENGIRLLIQDRPAAAVVLAEAHLARKESQAAASLLEAWRKDHEARVPEDLRRRARLVAARALVATGKPTDAIALLDGDARPESRLLVAEARLAAGQAAEAVVDLGRIVADARLAPELVERARNAYLEALLATGKLRDATSALERWPMSPEGAERDRRQLLVRRLQLLRDAAKKTSPGKPSPGK